MNKIKIALQLLLTFFPSSLRVRVLRYIGHNVCLSAYIGFGTILVANTIEVRRNARIEPLTLIFSPKVFKICESSRIASFVMIIGYGSVEIGDRSFIAIRSIVDCSTSVQIGSLTSIGPRSTIYSHGNSVANFSAGFPEVWSGVKIGSMVQICACVFLSPGTNIENNVFVSPGMRLQGRIRGRSVLALKDEKRFISRIELFSRPLSEEGAVEKINQILVSINKENRVDGSILSCFSWSRQACNSIIVSRVEDIDTTSLSDGSIIFCFGYDGEIPVKGNIFDFKTQVIQGQTSYKCDRLVHILATKFATPFIYESY